MTRTLQKINPNIEQPYEKIYNLITNNESLF